MKTWLRYTSSLLVVAIACGTEARAGEAYERGAASPPSCAKGEQLQEGTCFEKCKDGFEGKGTICLQICPKNGTDIGNSCVTGPAAFRKKRFERGPGRPAECRPGLELDAGACYAPCKPEFKGDGSNCVPA